MDKMPSDRWKTLRVRMAVNHEQEQAGVTVEQMRGTSRKAGIVAARKRVAKELRKVTYTDACGRRSHVFSFPEIGLILGRDHTTIMYAVDTPVLDEFRRGVARRRAVARGARVRAERQALQKKLYKLYDAGYCTPELSKHFRRAPATVAKLIKQYASELGLPDPIGQGRGRTGLLTRPVGEELA